MFKIADFAGRICAFPTKNKLDFLNEKNHNPNKIRIINTYLQYFDEYAHRVIQKDLVLRVRQDDIEVVA